MRYHLRQFYYKKLYRNEDTDVPASAPHLIYMLVPSASCVRRRKTSDRRERYQHVLTTDKADNGYGVWFLWKYWK